MTLKNSKRIWEAAGRLPHCCFGRRESAIGAGRTLPPEPRKRVTRGSSLRESAAFCPSPAFLALARAQRALTPAVGGACAAPTPSDASGPGGALCLAMGAPSPASYSACFLSGFLLAAALSSLGTDGKRRWGGAKELVCESPLRLFIAAAFWKHAPCPLAGGALPLPSRVNCAHEAETLQEWEFQRV